MKIHCDHCREELHVPNTAAGRWARCPSCQGKFKIPLKEDIEDLLEDTISKWIEEDVDDLIEEQNQRILHNTESQRQEILNGQRQRVSATSDRLEKELKSPTATQPTRGRGTSARLAAATAGAIRAPVKPTKTEKPDKTTDLSDHVGATGYPDQLFPTKARPHLVVDQCDQQGVTLAFDANFLEDERFTASLPMRCVFTDECDPTQLLARPLAFCDQTKDLPLSPHQIEADHESRLNAASRPQDIANAMGVLDMLPRPFHHPMPYYISTSQTTLSLACWTHRRSDHGVTAYVQLPEGFYALKWLAKVNGECGPEYDKLKREVDMLFGGEWRQLGEDCRRRLAVWCPFETDERFCHFVSDADFNHKDMGLAGLVLTDRRIVYQKYHKRGQIVYGQGTSLVIEPGEEGLAVVTIHSPQGKSKGISLHVYEVPKLLKVAQTVKLPVEVKLGEQHLPETTPATGTQA